MKKYRFLNMALILLISVCVIACQKMKKPELGDYPKDTNPPGGPLKFFAAFNGVTEDPLMNAVDSIRANFPSANPLKIADGINGKGILGENAKAIKYATPNDFTQATSFTVAFWFKRPVNTRTEFFFGLQDDTYGWSKSSLFMMAEHTTTTEATVKVGVMDQWMEFVNEDKLKKPMFDGNWHHWAMSYNETTSKMTYYFDGELITNAPAKATDVLKSGAPRGKLDLTKSTALSIGGWGKHIGVAGPTDDWVSSYTGQLDQFRMYATVLTAAEVKELFVDKK